MFANTFIVSYQILLRRWDRNYNILSVDRMINDDWFLNIFSFFSKFYIDIECLFIFTFSQWSLCKYIPSIPSDGENYFLFISFYPAIRSKTCRVLSPNIAMLGGCGSECRKWLVVTWNILIPCNYNKLEIN